MTELLLVGLSALVACLAIARSLGYPRVEMKADNWLEESGQR